MINDSLQGLRAIINKQGLTVAEAATEMKMSRAQLYNVLAGKFVGLKTLRRIERWTCGQVTTCDLCSLAAATYPDASDTSA